MNKEIFFTNVENKEVTFKEYVEWVFVQNEDTYNVSQNDSIQKTNIVTTALQDDQISDIIWLFRKCLNEFDLTKQNQAFLDLSHIIRHIFLFLLLLVQKNQDQKKLTTLMNSIGILNKDLILQITFADPSLDILKQKYPLPQILQQGNTFKKNHILILKIWSELKDVKLEGLKLPELDSQFIQDFQRLNVCLNMDQMLMIKAKNKEKEKEKIQQKEREKQLQAQRLFLSSLRKEKIHSVKIIKIDCKQSQSIFLQPNGNIVKGKIWFPQNIPQLCPLWLNSKVEIVSFCNQNNLNSDLRNYIGFMSYQGPVNDYFEPHTYDFDNETEGIMNTFSGQIMTYKGGFKNGLFDGKNRQYYYENLIYYGGFKNGQKHGEGYILENQNYMKGQFESNLKQGLFVDYKGNDFSKKEKIFQKIGSIFEYYKNGIRYDKPPADYQQQNVSQNPSCNLLNFIEYGINNFQLASLRPGGWINSSVIDILLNQLLTFVDYQQKNIGIPKMKTSFINCSLFQDIFGSIITRDEKINHNCINLEDQENRIVFYFNLDRSHFLSALYENQKLYLIDSLKDKRQAVTFQIAQFLQSKGFNVKEQYENCKISQQQNSYDCGAYTIYYVSQIIKHQHLTLQQMFEKNCFEITQPQINYLRYLIYQNLIGNGASIMEL